MLTMSAEAVDLMPDETDETADETADERAEETADEAGPERERASESGTSGPDESASDQPSAIDSLIGAFLEAGPEATEHLVRAAHELVLAAQTVIDAAARAVHEQQDVRSARRSDAEAATAQHLDPTE
jgi:hypothetical protein